MSYHAKPTFLFCMAKEARNVSKGRKIVWLTSLACRLTLLGCGAVGLIAGGLTISGGGPKHEALSSNHIVYARVDLFAHLATETPTLIPFVTPDWARTPMSIVGLSVPYIPQAGVEQWRSLVCSIPFTWGCDWALAVIACESGGNPNAVSYHGPFNGLFQVHNGPFDPYLNAVEAHIQYHEWQRGVRQVSPWPNCP